MANASDWLFVIPVRNLRIEKELRQRVVIGRVEFIRPDKLAYVRRQFGIAYRISQLCRVDPYFRKIVQGEEALAVLHVKLKGGQDFKEVTPECLQRVRDATAILSLSRCVYSRRRYREIFGIDVQSARAWQDYVFLEKGAAPTKLGPKPLLGGQLEGAHIPFILDKHWWNFHSKHGFFFALLDILYGSKRKEVSRSWRERLEHAALFAGRGWQTPDPVQAFLYNIFALETLLLESGGRTEDLAKRVGAFLGWAGFWGQGERFMEKIEDMHRVRHEIVHQADTSKFTIDHLLFSDDLIFNLFLNLVKHVRLFKKQEDVIDFCHRVEAERFLGLKSRVRPKSFRAMAPRYTDKDKAEI